MVEATDAATAVQFQIRTVGRFENLGGGLDSSIRRPFHGTGFTPIFDQISSAVVVCCSSICACWTAVAESSPSSKHRLLDNKSQKGALYCIVMESPCTPVTTVLQWVTNCVTSSKFISADLITDALESSFLGLIVQQPVPATRRWCCYCCPTSAKTTTAHHDRTAAAAQWASGGHKWVDRCLFPTFMYLHSNF